MVVTVERYEGHDEETEGFFQSAGAIHRFAAGSDEFRFNIEDSMPEYAACVRSVVDGREVMVQTRAPWAPSSPAVGIPLDNPLFTHGLREMMRTGVKFISIFDTGGGGFRQLAIAELLA